MKKTLFILTVLITCGFAFAAGVYDRFTVNAVYQNRDGSVTSRDWQIRMQPDQVRIGDANREYCILDIQEGTVVRITSWKRHRGKFQKFVVSDPVQIRLELATSFYPYEVVLERWKSEKSQRREWLVGTTVFRLVDKEQ